MIRGLYTSNLGMINNQAKLETISNNLANINTNGYKKDLLVSKSFSEVMTDVISNDTKNKIGKMSLGIGADEVVTDFSQGSVISTDNPLDLAFTDSELSFFCVDVPEGNGQTQEMYTRDGGFTVNNLGQLVTKDGNIIKGENGDILLKGGSIVINQDGSVLEDGQFVDKLLIKEFENSKDLKKYGNNLITANENAGVNEFTGKIIQGSIETSNINSITEMVDMINVMRTYEANQKVLRAHDETLEKAVSEVGRL